MLLGCIGDDFTGSSDLANTLAKGGMRTVQYVGVPAAPADSEVEAGVVSLKTRSIAPHDAVAQSLMALDWLKKQGCQQFFFKYCSTFDSTAQGNIGPVADALLEALKADYAIVCPAFPGAGRTIYMGHLFVDDHLLNESGMQNHPITPMTNSDIRRWIATQTRHSVGYVGIANVNRGNAVISAKIDEEVKRGNRLIVIDAIQDIDLIEIGIAAKAHTLITGGSGIATALPENFLKRGLISGSKNTWCTQDGPCVVLSGSCSIATRTQVAYHKERGHMVLELAANKIIEKQITPEYVASQLLDVSGIPLAYTSSDSEIVRAAQKRYGQNLVSTALEGFFADVAVSLRDAGVGCIITAGGETSGAVVEALTLQMLEIGPEIAPGVPALRAEKNLVLALKSGNFGAKNFFETAATILRGRT